MIADIFPPILFIKQHADSALTFNFILTSFWVKAVAKTERTRPRPSPFYYSFEILIHTQIINLFRCNDCSIRA
ncbi:hypothetical protein F6P82_01920 [Streptococcus suis]|nr:hypothetical protein [Streptococcus suis]